MDYKEAPLPNNVGAERAVLGSLLLGDDEGREAFKKLAKRKFGYEKFYQEKHQTIYRDGILPVYEKGSAVDLLTVADALTTAGQLEKVGGVPYLDELIESTPTAANVEYYANLVEEAAFRRAVLQVGRKADDDTVSVEELRGELEKTAEAFPGSTFGLPTEEPPTDDEFLAQDIPPTPMFIGRGLLPRVGFSAISAPTKVGKTTLCVQLCESIVSKTPFLGFPIEWQANILYCFLEGDEAGTQELMKQQRENWGVRVKSDYHVHPIHFHGLQMGDASHIAWLEKTIQNTGAQLVVLDPLSRCITGDINRREVVERFVRRLSQIGDALNVAWLLVHHTGKKTLVSREAIEQMLGSCTWGNLCETHIGMGRYSARRSPEHLRLVFDKRREAPLLDVCVYRNPATRLFELVENPDDIRPIPLDRVVEILKEQGKPISYTLLSTLVQARLGLSERPAKKLIAAAKEAGKIVKEDGRLGKYFLF